MTAAALHQLCKNYGETPVLSNVSVRFPEASVTAIIGRSGSGKSTLLRAVNGLVVPDAGRVEILGQPIDYRALPALRQQIGYAVQGTGLFPHLTIADNITLGARLQGSVEADFSSRLSELLDMVQLSSELLSRYPSELSGGQQQRAGIARALMLNPPLLLLDEPFAALDPLTRLDIQEQLLHLQRIEPRCTLLVTHDMREAMRLADHIVILEQGRLLLKEETSQLQRRYPDLGGERLLLTLLDSSA